MPIRKPSSRRADELREEYDLARLKNPVRGKYYTRATADTIVVHLDPDVAEAFPSSRSVNEALRLLLRLARRSVSKSRSARRRPI